MRNTLSLKLQSYQTIPSITECNIHKNNDFKVNSINHKFTTLGLNTDVTFLVFVNYSACTVGSSALHSGILSSLSFQPCTPNTKRNDTSNHMTNGYNPTDSRISSYEP